MVSRNNTEGAIDLLKELKGFNMTLKLLQETRIGMSVNSIRKHCRDEEVVSLAKVLIKEWKRLLDSGNTHSEKAAEIKNGLDSRKPAAAATNSSSSEPQSSHRRLEAELKHESGSDKNRDEKQNDNHINKKRHVDDLRMDGKHPGEHQSEKHLQEIRAEKQIPAVNPKVEMENKKERHVQHLQSGKHKSDPIKERSLEDLKKIRHAERLKKEKRLEEPKKHADKEKMDKNREESRHEWPVSTPQREKPAEAHKRLERRGVLDSTVLYPTRFLSPPRPGRPLLPIKSPSLDSEKDRKDSKESSSRHPHSHGPQPASPPPKRPAVEVKKDRKQPPDPNAPLPPLPLYLHLPAPPPKRPSMDGSKDSSRKSFTDSKLQQKKSADSVKKDRKDSDDGKASKKLSDDTKQERRDSSDSKSPPPKKPSVEVKKEKHRKDSSDMKPCLHAKGNSTESKAVRRESTDSKRCSSPPAKKIMGERRESLGSKPPGQPQRKPSTDSIERKGKTEAPRTPTTPTSPMSPSFSSPGGPLPPYLATGDSIRDKCIEMLAAALRTDNDYKDFGANCDSMAAEIEDHILYF
ncbi:hypothetical protein CRENBAI_008908 [Crenichthys baileyi]|uniref:TFIIS N-terminal domain-containing protein n=1 Tax=Crenichthys baileyi TaxID=28760 RepID=A0AAV9R8L7_9TELE